MVPGREATWGVEDPHEAVPLGPRAMAVSEWVGDLLWLLRLGLLLGYVKLVIPLTVLIALLLVSSVAGQIATGWSAVGVVLVAVLSVFAFGFLAVHVIVVRVGVWYVRRRWFPSRAENG